MAKKKKKEPEREVSDELLSAFEELRTGGENINADRLAEISDMAFGTMSEDEKDEFEAMWFLAMQGVTPDDYAQFYQSVQFARSMIEEPVDMPASNGYDDVMNPFFGLTGFHRFGSVVKEYKPLKDASNHTLVLKIQMKDVTKPPMWREVEIPADYNFEQLHDVIQVVTGLENSHLWQFNVKAYDDSLLIGFSEEGDFHGRLQFVTHEADETPLTQFLQQKGDKLEYVYDFGDDWIFSVEVKELAGRKIEHPVCRKFKSELNALEDFGGIWDYLSAREDYEEWGKLTNKERKQRADNHGFESADEYLQFLNENRISLDDVNEALEFI